MAYYKAVPYSLIKSVQKEGFLPSEWSGRVYLAGSLKEVAEAAIDLYYEGWRQEGINRIKWGIFQVAQDIPRSSLISDPESTSYGREKDRFYYTKSPIEKVKLIGIFNAKKGTIKYLSGKEKKLFEPWD